MRFLSDAHGRAFKYLRLSLTEECNFKCVYCLPDGYKRSQDYDFPLTRSEIKNLVSAFAGMCFSKVRLTGGEPTLRRDIVEIVSDVAATRGIEKTALTTNAYRLKELARPLKDAGLSSVNISLDTLDHERFRQITGTDRLNDVLHGIDAAAEAGFHSIKINAVLMKDFAENDFHSLVEWVKDKPFSMRFIELMRTGSNLKLFEKQQISSGDLKLKLLQNGWEPLEREQTDGPAIRFSHADYRGTVGIIAPYSTGFCDSCNRLRVSSRGGLRMCLFGEKDHSLRGYLKSPEQSEMLITKVHELIAGKDEHHHLDENRFGVTSTLSSIGG